MNRSFRFQLALRAMLGVAVGLGVLSVVTLMALRLVLDRELDSSIRNVASIQAASLANGDDGEMSFHEWELTPEEAESVQDLIRYAEVWRADGVSLLRSRYMTSPLPRDLESLARASANELVWARQTYEGAPVRTLFYPLVRLGAAHDAHVLQVAAPLGERNRMLGRVGAFLAVLTALMAAASFWGSWWLAGRAVRPILEIIDQAEEIGAGSLDRGIQAYPNTLEYRRLVEVLNTMLKRIRTGFESQKRFTADASHELRSPLTVMRGEIEVALRRNRDPEEYRAVLGSTLEEVNRLARITEDLLTLARSDAGALRPRLETVDPVVIARRVVEKLSDRSSDKKVELVLNGEVGRFCLLDPGLVGQILWNLTDNALKFTPDQGRVTVSVGEVSGSVELVVEDTGRGLGVLGDNTPFERFYRADEARTYDDGEGGGTGLGLAIVKAMVEAHGGSVEAASELGRGARFVVLIPAEGWRDSDLN